ncbi:MAG: hypothetical protein NUV77_18745, partial [Thermoguttaceae bacterium]|nr:hypothetical protein [Thermoguttaceae bacterium]
MGSARRYRLVRAAGVFGVLVLAASWAAAQNVPLLRYNFQAGRAYAYEVKILADFGDEEETR